MAGVLSVGECLPMSHSKSILLYVFYHKGCWCASGGSEVIGSMTTLPERSHASSDYFSIPNTPAESRRQGRIPAPQNNTHHFASRGRRYHSIASASGMLGGSDAASGCVARNLWSIVRESPATPSVCREATF